MDYNTRTLVREVNQYTGEVIDERYTEPEAHSRYIGPRKYSRVMDRYDEALRLLASPVGVDVLLWLKSEVNNSGNYTVHINQSTLAADIGTTRARVSSALKKLIDGDYIIKLKRPGYYMVDQRMIWPKGMEHWQWQGEKQDYLSILEQV